MPAHPRFDSIDALRGVAIAWMTVFHFCFDLNFFGYWRQNFYADPFWIGQRTFILSLFLFCAGFAQAVALAHGQGWQRFWKRWLQIAACALLVTAGSYAMFPNSYIFFGVLHGIAAMLIIVRLTAGWGQWLWLAGVLAVAAGVAAPAVHAALPSLDFLNRPGWHWLGLVSRKPITEDFVPVFPWLGPMWWGMAAGQRMVSRARVWLAAPLPRSTAVLQWLGRHSLAWYMLHQPVLIGCLMVFSYFFPAVTKAMG